jgi:RNA polymerase sigma factor (sigma-70 family)
VATRQVEFERIAVPHTRSLLRVARRLTSDSASAEDLVQETMLLAWRGFDRFEEGTNARAWLFRILFNAFYTRGRKMRAAPLMVSYDGVDQESTRELQTSPELLDTTAVNRALEQLSVEHRSVLLLGAVEGFTCREMAEILAVPIGTVASRLNRARQALSDRLAPASPSNLPKARPTAQCAQKEAI